MQPYTVHLSLLHSPYCAHLAWLRTVSSESLSSGMRSHKGKGIPPLKSGESGIIKHASAVKPKFSLRGLAVRISVTNDGVGSLTGAGRKPVIQAPAPGASVPPKPTSQPPTPELSLPGHLSCIKCISTTHSQPNPQILADQRRWEITMGRMLLSSAQRRAHLH